MKLQLCAEIEGQFLLNYRVEAKLYPFVFEIYEEKGQKFISITKPIVDYIDYAPKIYTEDGITYIEATKPEIYKDMEDWLYYIEAMGAFNLEVTKIHTDELEVKWICETEEEKGLIPISSLKRNKQKTKSQKYLRNENLSNLVTYRRMLPNAHIPYSYYRQAKTFFEHDDYYFAFINYFMMLEFCFAEGKFKTKEVEDRFLKSQLLKLCILSAVSMIRKQENRTGNYKWLSNECKQRNKSVNFEGIVCVLIEYRGLLSHASIRSKEYLFDKNKLRPLAFIASVICFLLCGYMQVYSCSSDNSKKELMAKKIRELELEYIQQKEVSRPNV